MIRVRCQICDTVFTLGHDHICKGGKRRVASVKAPLSKQTKRSGTKIKRVRGKG